jgi:hypothetical protein
MTIRYKIIRHQKIGQKTKNVCVTILIPCNTPQKTKTKYKSNFKKQQGGVLNCPYLNFRFELIYGGD